MIKTMPIPNISSRRVFLVGAATIFGGWPILVHAATTQTHEEKFKLLSTQGNSNCSAEFLDSISKMSKDARLRGSCCSPMELTRYKKQIEGLVKYNIIADIPPDSYDIEAGLATRLLGYYDLALTTDEKKEYDYAMEHSHEKGPCCCRCWRWKVYGGLGKLLIREHGMNGKQVTEVWDLSDGCGGA